MGMRVQNMRVPMTDAGFNYSRNFELLPDNALMYPSCNFNLHNNGVEARGGTSILGTTTVSNQIMGGYDFRQSNGNQYMVYAKNNGIVYANNDSYIIASGMSTQDYFQFSQFQDTLYISDGATLPQMWNGSGLATGVTPASDFASDEPFMIVFHPEGANFRNWAITPNAVYASKNNVGYDFSDADVTVIPVYTVGGIVAAIDFGGVLFVMSKTETFLIQDTNSDPTQWGYQKAIWDGGAAHFRVVVKADNDVYVMADDLTIYSLNGVFQTGNYRKSGLTRPASIDRFLREQANFGNVANWHAAYDPKLRCVKWFIQVGGSGNNIALVQFIDKPADKMWAIHQNASYPSGYNALASWTTRKSPSDWRIRTGDYSGNVWELEGTQRNDNNNPIPATLLWKPWEFENPLMHKSFARGVLRVDTDTQLTFDATITVNNITLPEQDISVINTQGAQYDISTYDNCQYGGDNISNTPFDIRSFGRTLQLELQHENLDEDFFLAEVIIGFKNNGERLYA